MIRQPTRTPRRSVPLKEKGSITPHRTSRRDGPAGIYMPFSLIAPARRSGEKDHLSFRKKVSLIPVDPNTIINPANRHTF